MNKKELFDEITADLLTPLWLGLDADYKRKYSMKIWEQFQNNLLSAAYTADLGRFLQKITSRLPVQVSEANAGRVQAICESGRDDEILKAIRENTALLVLKTRVANEERKEKRENTTEARINVPETLGLFTGENE
jgi:hypothetical protein